jgi:acetylornithine deacetylase/succinyl-diaminopimelate desuccinylase-like protein
MNELINRILEIPLPRKPRSGIVLGSIEGGTSYGVRATRALLRIQIRSESWDKVQELLHTLEELVEEVSSNTGYEGQITVAAKRKPGGIPFSHPLVDCGRQILESLSIKPRITPSTGGLSAFFSRGIPAVAIGLTTGENAAEENESIDIEPIYTGMTQLLGLILALDKGYCGVVE